MPSQSSQPYTNPNAALSISLRALLGSLWKNRHLILPMIKREVIGRYRGSILGILWSFVNPLLMLVVYTFAFSVVFKARWGDGGETKAHFASVLFVGMIVHGIFSEVIGRAPAIVFSHINFVKKVVFPLEILPVVITGAALFHCAISTGILLLSQLLITGTLSWTIILIPLVLFPFVILLLGGAWLLASLGVFIRDASPLINMFTTVLMFLSPVFYPLSAVPEKYHPIILANPLTFIIEQARAVLLFGKLPNWWGLLIYFFAATIIAWLGFAWFQKTRKGFADVL